MDKLLTLRHIYIYMYMYMYMYMYVCVCAVESKLGPRFGLFGVKTWSKVASKVSPGL